MTLKFGLKLWEMLGRLTAVGSSVAWVTCETSQVLLVGGQVFFLGDLPFSPHRTIDWAQNEWNNLMGHKTQIITWGHNAHLSEQL